MPATTARPPTLARALLLGCRAGLLVFLVLYTLCALLNMQLGYQGNESRIVTDWVWTEWRDVVLWQVARLLAAYCTVGLVLGALLGAGLWAAQRSRRAVFWGSGLGCLVVEGMLVLGDMARHPHVYAATLYARSEVTAALLRGVSGTQPSGWYMAALVLPVLSVLALVARALVATPRWRGVMGGTAAAVVVAGFTGLGLTRAGRDVEGAAPVRPNLLILASDGLRPDHLSGSGYSRATSPNIDRLMDEGTRFDDTVVQVPRTAPSWTTLLTSQWAGEHPVTHTLVGREAREAKFTTLATVLAAQGYRTAVVADYAGDHFSRFEYGFQQVSAPDFRFPDLIRQRMLITNVALLPWTALAPGLFPERGQFPELTDPAPLRARVHHVLEDLPEDAPFALVVFASSTHFPYAAPWPQEGRFVERGYRGPWRFGSTPRMEVDPDAPAPTPEDVAALGANYDAGVLTFDGLVGSLRKDLERRGRWDDTLVVLLSDHGEHLEDEGLGQGHGDHLWGRAALRIPFVVRLPGRVAAGRAVTQRARSLDVAPTLLELLGVDAPESFRGRSLASLVQPGPEPRPLPDVPALIETDLWFSDRDGQPYQTVRIPYPWIYETATVEPDTGQIALKPEWEGTVLRARHRGLYLGRWKLLELPTPEGVKVQLFDVVGDPAEKLDVAGDFPNVVTAMRAKLAAERPDASADPTEDAQSPGVH
ncbi:arylsulfatase [Corallococcus praedator]|uniref:Arylsulfatase n=1 Tax=Corallococcus praedator TaxID=2316724 RepID=A0ABX9QME9_9BACT|nr:MULTISPECIES: sulfatase [Corallococcus]RKH32818.1 arylsulfatase [Corallococcus sp. CA031C]RKI13476.1 arylsulfatase [Corallococcus praedator]